MGPKINTSEKPPKGGPLSETLADMNEWNINKINDAGSKKG